MKKLKMRFVSLALIVMLIGVSLGLPNPAYADEEEETEEHYLGFASDLHDTADALEEAFGSFSNNPEYVSLIGDMVGARGGDAPAFNSSEILNRIQAIETCKDINSSSASIIWADHDAGVTDDVGIVKAMGDPAGYTSGEIYEGKNQDGSTAYYIYAVGFYHMLDGGETSKNAAQEFKDWVDGKDVTIPIIVLCHAPLLAKRGDNYGATYWNEALNYAATGVEGITSEEQEGIPIIRNIIYMSGHNHTVDQSEYVYPVGSIMSVQVDNKDGQLSAGENWDESEAYDEEIADLAEALALASGTPLAGPNEPNVKATGSNSIVYYTAITPGYLKTSRSATLLKISKDAISLTKYDKNGTTDLGVTSDGNSVVSPYNIEPMEWDEPTYEWSEDLSKVTATHVLKNNPDYKESETVNTTSEVTKEATTTEPGEKTYTAVFSNSAFETQTKTEEIPVAFIYEVIDGDGLIWTKGSDETADFTFKRSYQDDVTFSHFAGIKVDGETVDASNYEAESGSVIVRLRSVYLETLDVGDHELTALFDDGDGAAANFTIVSKSEEDDSDDNAGDNDNDGNNDNDGDNSENRDDDSAIPSDDSGSNSNNSSGENSSNNSKNNSSGGNSSSNQTSGSNPPKTGDSTDIVIWIILVIASTIVFDIINKKRKREIK